MSYAALTLALRLALGAAIATSLMGCGYKIDFVQYFKAKKKKKKPANDEAVEGEQEDPNKPADLGTAGFPAGTKTPIAQHDWQAKKLKPTDYKLGYALGDEAQKQVLAAHHRFAKLTNYTDLGKGRFTWNIPPGCERDMGCAFGVMTDSSQEAMKPLIELFRKRAQKNDLKADELASLIVTFVQHIRYERPKDQPFEILPPASVVAEMRGDCDSKSLLAHLLLREFNIDSVMLSSRAHGHAMLGVAIPAPGRRFKFGGREYAFTELTADNSPIGHINPQLLHPDDWKIVPTRWPTSGWESGR